MKIKTPITKERLRTHFTYHFWKYLLVIAASVFGWNILYTTTAYRSPENLRIDLYIQSAGVTEQSAAAFVEPIWKDTVPEMESVSSVLLANAQDYYSSMQLSVYMMAGEGDIYLLSPNDFKSFAAQGVFVDLEPIIEDGRLDVGDIDLAAGYIAQVDSDGIPIEEKKLYGIPASTLTGLQTGMGLERDLMISVTTFNGNDDNVIAFLNAFIEAGRGAAR